MIEKTILEHLLNYGVLGIMGFFFLRNSARNSEMIKKTFEATNDNYKEFNNKLLSKIDESLIETRNSVFHLSKDNREIVSKISDIVAKQREYTNEEIIKIMSASTSNSLYIIYIELQSIVDRNNLIIERENILNEISSIIISKILDGRNNLRDMNIPKEILDKFFTLTDEAMARAISIIQSAFDKTIDALEEVKQQKSILLKSISDGDCIVNVEALENVEKSKLYKYNSLKRILHRICDEFITETNINISKLIMSK